MRPQGAAGSQGMGQLAVAQASSLKQGLFDPSVYFVRRGRNSFVDLKVYNSSAQCLCAWKEAKRSFRYLFSFLFLAHQGRARHSSIPQHFSKDVGLVHFCLVGLAPSGYKGV